MMFNKGDFIVTLSDNCLRQVMDMALIMSRNPKFGEDVLYHTIYAGDDTGIFRLVINYDTRLATDADIAQYMTNKVAGREHPWILLSSSET